MERTFEIDGVTYQVTLTDDITDVIFETGKVVHIIDYPKYNILHVYIECDNLLYEVAFENGVEICCTLVAK